MNQNRNNNRRRGRGNNRGGPGGGGGGPQGNRIDSRARGNAPQMLEKYRKLAHDASLNGDRVQTEYYLQFADHYFRVVADSRTQSQKDEQRPRRDEHQSSSSYDAYESDDRDDRDDGDERDDAPQAQPARGGGGGARDDDDRGSREEGARASEGDEADSAAGHDNPFTREPRSGQPRSASQSGARPRGRNRPAADARPAEENGAGPESSARQPREQAASARSDDDASFDPGLLPPSIPRDEEPAPRPRKRRARPAVNGDDEALEATS